MINRSDVLVAGGGIVGLSLALALKRALGPGLSVELWDPALGRRSPPQRASAIAAASRRMLERLGVWAPVADKAQAIVRMDITDSRLEDAVRPLFLRFDGEAGPGEPFAHMILNGDLEAVLEREVRDAGVVLRAEAVRNARADSVGALVESESGRQARFRLIAAADGARSPLREMAGIRSISWSYAAQALVFSTAHARDHEGVARQHFLPEGPFAVLPLPGRRSSIVWTVPTKTAARLTSLPGDEFERELERRFGLELGEPRAVEAPLSFDVTFSLARSLIGPRLALVGDAAHRIHPLAGQGLNLGLRDAAALAETIVEHARLGLDPGSGDALRAYERVRRFDAFTMALATDALHRIFAADGPMRLARDFGLGLTDRAPPLKAALIQEAAGLRISPPRLLRGEPL